jgi:very-short-patch-repair endonuclease
MGMKRFKSRARQLRETQTNAEARLWQALRNRRLAHWKFRRQHPIDRYIVDFPSPGFLAALEIRPLPKGER